MVNGRFSNNQKVMVKILEVSDTGFVVGEVLEEKI